MKQRRTSKQQIHELEELYRATVDPTALLYARNERDCSGNAYAVVSGHAVAYKSNTELYDDISAEIFRAEQAEIFGFEPTRTAIADEYGEALGLVGLVPNTHAYEIVTDEYIIAIGYTLEWDEAGSWSCEIDDRSGAYVACCRGKSPRQALDNATEKTKQESPRAVSERIAEDAMKSVDNCEDAVNEIAYKAFKEISGRTYPRTMKEYQQLDDLMGIASEIVRRDGPANGISWEEYQECEYDAHAAAAALLDAYAEAIGEHPTETDPEAVAAHRVAYDEIAHPNGATDADRAIVADMVKAIAYSVYADATEQEPEPRELYQRADLEAFFGDYVDDYDLHAIEKEATEHDADGRQYWCKDVDLMSICERHELQTA